MSVIHNRKLLCHDHIYDHTIYELICFRFVNHEVITRLLSVSVFISSKAINSFSSGGSSGTISLYRYTVDSLTCREEVEVIPLQTVS
jgi:hypothetical protein